MPKILLIDDELFIREHLKRLLLLESYNVITAENAIEAMTIFNEENPEIVLLDIKMPDIDGIEILKKIKKQSPVTEVIMITGHGGVDTAIQTLKEGAFGYIQKPVDYTKLLIEILKALDKQKMQIKLDNYLLNLEKAIKEKTEELNKRIIAEEALRANINEGRVYQAKLIKIKIQKIYNINFDASYIPFDKVGGDFYNILLCNDNLLFYSADISGHGISAAIISSFIKALLDNWIKNDGITSPLTLIKLLKHSLENEEIFQENMVVIFIGNLNIKSLELTYLSAGHHLPIIITQDKDGKEQYINLETTYRPLSNMFGQDSYNEKNITLTNNTKFFLYSDGIIEWKNENNVITGNAYLYEYIKKNKLSKKSIMDLINIIIKNKQEDDISFILIDINNNFENFYNCDLEDHYMIINDIKNELTKRYNADNNIFLKIYNCLEEALVNAIEHGNKNSKEKKIHLKMNFEKNKIIFYVIDQGEGFDWKKYMSIKSVHRNEIRGRGFFILKHFANDFQFNEKGNEISITFILENI